jgi:hypothetical protein
VRNPPRDCTLEALKEFKIDYSEKSKTAVKRVLFLVKYANERIKLSNKALS